MRWTPEILARLGKEPDGAIADAMGVRGNAVMLKLKELGIPAYNAVHWTPELRKKLGKLSDAKLARLLVVIAGELGASVSTVRAKRRELGIPLRLRRGRA